MSPLKIALLTYSTKPRGSVIHTLELAEALYDLGHQSCIYALDKDGQGFDYPLSCDRAFVPAKPASTEIDALIKQRIQEFIDYLTDSDAYDIYHAQDCISANALAALVQQNKIDRFIRTVHHIEDYSSPYLQHCQDRSIREASLCLCVSDRTASDLEQYYQIQAPRVINGVNLRRFSPHPNGMETSLIERFGLTGSPIYLTVGGVEPRKNSIRLLQAFKQVLEHYPNAQLVISGGATVFDYQSYRTDFLTIAHNLNIISSLILPGVLSDAELSALYRLADSFVFPSIKEGWGLVVLEAIASQCPVITSNQAPFTEFLSEFQALLVDPYSIDEIAKAMIAIVNCADSLIQQSQSVLSAYTWENSAKLHVHHYQKLLNTYA